MWWSFWGITSSMRSPIPPPCSRWGSRSCTGMSTRPRSGTGWRSTARISPSPTWTGPTSPGSMWISSRTTQTVRWSITVMIYISCGSAGSSSWPGISRKSEIRSIGSPWSFPCCIRRPCPTILPMWRWRPSIRSMIPSR